MRPPILNPLFVEARMLKGVGPEGREADRKSARHGSARAAHPRSRVPSAVQSRRPPLPAEADRRRTRTHRDGDGQRARSQAAAARAAPALSRAHHRRHRGDGDRVLHAARGSHPQGAAAWVPSAWCRAGSTAISDRLQMAHPDFIAPPEDTAAHPRRGAGLLGPPDQLRRALAGEGRRPGARAGARSRRNGRTRRGASAQGFAVVRRVRCARRTRRKSEADLSLTSNARMRLAYDELLANQLALALVRDNTRRQPGRALQGRRAHATQGGSRPALQADGRAVQSDRRNPRRHGGVRAAWCGCCRAMSARARPWSR